MLASVAAGAQYTVRYRIEDSAGKGPPPVLTGRFAGAEDAEAYVAALPARLQAQGYVTASVDSIRLGSKEAQVTLYIGRRYRWARLRTRSGDDDLFNALRFNRAEFEQRPLDFPALRQLQERLLARLEETGHPFAKIWLDSLRVEGEEVSGLLAIERGLLYRVDSIRVYGDVNINNELLQRHLDLPNGSVYNKRRLQEVDRRLAELTYVELERPSDLTLLATGSVLNVYLKNRRNNQVNALIGLLPNPERGGGRSFQLTGEANLLLRNSLGGGETIALNWQQLQLGSPRLQLGYEQPYFLRSPVGFAFAFEMFRKDTTFLNLSFDLSARYRNGRGMAQLFFQRRSTVVNGVNVEQVKASRQLPAEADISSNSLGGGYEWNGTDYRFNPRRGTEYRINGSAGIKRLKPNTQVLAIKDPNDPSFSFSRLYDTVPRRTYQFRVVGAIAHHLPLGRVSTLRLALNAGIFLSGTVFRNELFQIGGYKLLRGFDEESEYLSQYAVLTTEYRYLLARNSYFFVFSDGGWGRQPAPDAGTRLYLSSGLGLSFETRAGIFNLAWALGRRDDLPFNLRRSKVHLGFVSYF